MRNEMDQQISVIEHLKGILESIDDDLILALRSHEKANRGGFMSIPRSVFCYVDYLGALMFKGTATTQNAIKYMEKYFTAVNARYSGKCEAMYDMWRHGTVHEYDAKVYSSKTKRFKLLWGANNSSETHNRDSHLKCFCMEDEPDNYYLFINHFELVEDLISSVNYFIKDIESDPSTQLKANNNLKKLSRDVDLDKLSKSIPDILSATESIVGHAVGIINSESQVIKNFGHQKEFEQFKDQWHQ